jgi:hypothetical protein
MRDDWYGDKRDLVKWGCLLRLAQKHEAKTIVQIAFYRATRKWPAIEGLDEPKVIPEAVRAHFRSIRRGIGTTPYDVVVCRDEFIPSRSKREEYTSKVVAELSRHKRPLVVLLDPDTGLEPESGKLKPEHVRAVDVTATWQALHDGDVHYLAPGTTKKVAAQKTMQVLVGKEEPDRGNS